MAQVFGVGIDELQNAANSRYSWFTTDSELYMVKADLLELEDGVPNE